MSAVLAGVIDDIAPDDPLSKVQRAWPDLVGRRHAPHSAPSHVRKDGAIAVRCDSGALAAELELMAPQLAELLLAATGLRTPLRFEGPAGRRR